MASLLRQIVAGPRAKHQETGLDLCYVTSNIIATSGPSQTYPQRAYRNPLDRLVAFLDSKHGDDWAIWEFRAEGTGYPDEAVYGRVRHYPWPDHHPPPFRLVPMIMASMRNWLHGGEIDGNSTKGVKQTDAASENHKRVVVVHCKAGKGRSGTMSCSYLISECGWKPEDALARFTERRMRPKFGAGVSIPSQLRWISYVDRWTKGGKKYVDREIEILEIHVWGLRHGVKVSVEGFADEGKKIRVFHTFKRAERYVIEGNAPGSGGIGDFLGDALSPRLEDEEGEIEENVDYNEVVGGDKSKSDGGANAGVTKSATEPASKPKKGSPAGLMRKLSRSGSKNKVPHQKSRTINMATPDTSVASSSTSLPPNDVRGSTPSLVDPKTQSQASLSHATTFADQDEPGGQAVIFKPAEPIKIPNSDINIAVERRNRAPASMGLTMVTAVAHVWFNPFFEGGGPEKDGVPDDSGVFEIEWDRMDGIKGSSRKGTRAADRISVVWRAAGSGEVGVEGQSKEDGKVVISEPAEGEEVPQMKPADWKGDNKEDPTAEKRLGLRTEDPDSASVSKASSIKSQDMTGASTPGTEAKDEDPLEGVKTSGPMGEEQLDEASRSLASRLKKKTDAAKEQTDHQNETGGGTAQKGFIIE